MLRSPVPFRPEGERERDLRTQNSPVTARRMNRAGAANGHSFRELLSVDPEDRPALRSTDI